MSIRGLAKREKRRAEMKQLRARHERDNVEVDESYFVLHQQLAEYIASIAAAAKMFRFLILLSTGGLFYKFFPPSPILPNKISSIIHHSPNCRLLILSIISLPSQGKSIFVSARRKGKLILPSEHCLHTVRTLNQPCFISKSAREIGQLQTNILQKCPT